MGIVITGIDGLRNRGVEALVVSTIEQLQIRQPSVPIDILTGSREYDEYRLQKYEGVNLTDSSLKTFNSLKVRRSRLKRILDKVVPGRKAPASPSPASVKALREASVVIASGGDLFSSDYGGCYRHLEPLNIALDAGASVVFLAQSIGPFKTSEESEAWLGVARRSRLITVREKFSYNYITQDLGLPTSLVQHTADPAFLLPPPPATEVDKMLSSYGLSKERPVVALAVSQGINRYAGCDYQEHLQVLGQIVTMLVNELDAQVLLIPHVQDARPKNDDRILATNILKFLNFDPHIRLAGMDHTASEFKGLIGACDMVIAERMHAAIAGLSSGVCPLVIGYSVKARGIMADLLGSADLDKELLIPVHEFLNIDTASSLIRNAWKIRQDVSTHLNQVLPHIKQKTATNYDLISQLLN